MAEPRAQICPICGGFLKENEVTHDETWGDKLYRFELVPALVCSKCGETFFSAEVNEVLEEIVNRDEKPDRYQEVRIPVFTFTRYLREKTAT